MSLADTASALLTARRALNDAELAHANAIAAEVRASVPGPWVAVPEVGAIIEQGNIEVGVSWGPSGWTVWAAAPGDGWFRGGTPPGVTTPHGAMMWLRGVLVRCYGANGQAALRIVVRLLRGWA